MRCQLGFAYAEMGRLDDAATEFTKARDIDRAIGHARGEATAVESLGLLMLRRCGAEDLPALRTVNPRFAEQALKLLTDNLRQNLAMAPEHDDKRAVALAWRHLGRGFDATGEYDEAVRHLLRARELLQAISDGYNVGKTLTDLGRSHLRFGRDDDARAALGDALELLPAEDSPAERAIVLELLAALDERAGDRDGAAERLTAALAVLYGRDNPQVRAVRERLAVITGQV